MLGGVGQPESTSQGLGTVLVPWRGFTCTYQLPLLDWHQHQALRAPTTLWAWSRSQVSTCVWELSSGREWPPGGCGVLCRPDAETGGMALGFCPISRGWVGW